MHLLDPITAKPKEHAKLSHLGLNTWWDLALHLPLRYQDLTQIYPIAKLQAGMQVQIEGRIIGYEIKRGRTKQLIVRVDDGTAIISLLFFHFYSNYSQQYATGKQIRAHGEIKIDFSGNKTIIHPKVQTVTTQSPSSNTFSSIYPITNGLTNRNLSQLIEQLFAKVTIPELLPESICHHYQLLSFEQALIMLHQLTPQQYAENLHQQALRRLKFDELIAQQLLMRNIYLQHKRLTAPALKPTHKYIIPLLANLKFKLTHAQQRVVEEILADLKRPEQMHRLLQGDVGSGKTIVATVAALVAVENGYQAVIMAPTEILAEQHYLKTKALLEPLAITVIWLTGSLSPKQKQQAITSCQDGSGQLIIGTHAVFQKNVEFRQLGLVIIDEQHRFGVEQRLALVSKGQPNLSPHQLMMSATPIPRSLALSYYADLEVSNIDELPPGRTPIQTILVKQPRRPEVITFVQQYAKLGQQAYWVCPLIEESEKLELENALATWHELSTRLAPIRVGLVHGKMKAKDKAAVMTEFATNQIQILVATTVIEVGVDVPNASIMVIEHSERMGLAQLHQLRGRVGRGSNASQCVLLYDPSLSDLAKQRLKVIAHTSDGFEIARQDLLIRGPGELLGQRQSGLPGLRFANLEHDLAIVEAARKIAITLAREHPQAAASLVELWFYNQQIYRGV